ncbi:MAG: winged helix-turn-helix domain-containing protein [Candidatus Bathyarchaeia archaeon]
MNNEEHNSVNHRGRMDIIADIISASVGGIKKTHLMFQCNLSFRQMKSYSHFLIKRGFLRIVVKEDDVNNGSFEATEKGKQFLKAYKGLKSLMQ